MTATLRTIVLCGVARAVTSYRRSSRDAQPAECTADHMKLRPIVFIFPHNFPVFVLQLSGLSAEP